MFVRMSAEKIETLAESGSVSARAALRFGVRLVKVEKYFTKGTDPRVSFFGNSPSHATATNDRSSVFFPAHWDLASQMHNDQDVLHEIAHIVVEPRVRRYQFLAETAHVMPFEERLWDALCDDGQRGEVLQNQLREYGWGPEGERLIRQNKDPRRGNDYLSALRLLRAIGLLNKRNKPTFQRAQWSSETLRQLSKNARD